MASGGEGAGSGESPPAASVEAAAGEATLHIRCANGSKFTVQTDLGATVGAFKEVVAGSCDVPAPQQRLIYKGRILKDEQTLESYGTCHAETLGCRVKYLSIGRRSVGLSDSVHEFGGGAGGVVNSTRSGLSVTCLFVCM
jgi:ubiquilin